MTITTKIVSLLMLVSLSLPSLLAAEEGNKSDDAVRILVTFADPGMRNAHRGGPARPSYRRSSGSYTTSVAISRSAKRIAKLFGLQKIDEWPIRPLAVFCVVYALDSERTTDLSVDTLISKLEARNDVESVQRLNTFSAFGTAQSSNLDPYARFQHVLDTLEIPQAHAWTRGQGARIAVVDTGADLRHPELAGQIAEHQDFVGTKNRGGVADAHGTAVAGIIAASINNGEGIVGVAPEAHLSILKACWYLADKRRAVCDSFTLARALSHAIESAADIINLSLGGPPDPLLARLIHNAIDKGITVVAAAPADTLSGFPTNVPGVLVVAADSAGADSGHLSAVNAPGDEILVAAPHDSYDFASGSSLAAAHVSGIAALLVAAQPKLSGKEVRQLIVDSPASTRGIVNACRALAPLFGDATCGANGSAAR